MLKPPRPRKPRDRTAAQQRVIDRIKASMPPVVVLSVSRDGRHYAIGNGGSIGKGMVRRLIGRGELISNGDGMFSDMPQTYRLSEGV